MPVIPAVVVELLRSDAPVLFLDTCDLLHIVRAIPRELPRYPVAAVRLRTALQLQPPVCRLVLSHLVRTEWAANSPGAVEESRKHLAKIDLLSTGFHDVRDVVGTPLTFPRAGYAAAGVTEGLLALSQQLLNAALEIDHDAECVQRAVRRVFSNTPPAQNGKELKDCTILEEYLSVARELRAAGFGRKLVFCSSNVKDYCEAKSFLHHELAAEFAPLALEYKSNLEGAVGELLQLP
jgi:hypothetical protein